MTTACANVARWIHRHAETAGEHPAIVEADRTLDYGALEERCQRAAGVLREAGVGAGDRVALLLANRSAYLEVVFAAARLGAIAVPLNARLAPREIAQLIDDCRPHALVHEAALDAESEKACAAARHAPAVRIAVGGSPDAYESALSSARPWSAIADVDPDDPVILMYTSGTTGVPKGALLPHRKTLFNSLNAQLFFDLTRRDRVLVVVPLFHSFGLKILAIPTLYAGGTLVLERGFSPAALWRRVGEQHVTFLGGVPTMFRALDAELTRAPGAYDLSTLRFLFTAGAAIPVELIHAFEARGLRLKQGFGQTETSILCCLDAADAVRKAGSVGRPVLHADVRLVRQAGLSAPPAQWQDCDAGETGEIVVRGPITMLGYWERPEATAETIREGWLRTGDLAVRDEEGFFTLTGRARDMFISGGENVYPREVEAVFEEHPDVAEIAVIGVSDERWGEVGCAFVVPRDGRPVDDEALRSWGRERLAAFKVPQRFIACAGLPRTETGKVQKYRLCERAKELG